VRISLQTLFIWVIKTNQFMVEAAKVAVCSQINAKRVNTVCGENVQMLNVKLNWCVT
jgi:hypothetical protein